MGEGEAATAVIQDVTAAADVFMFANDQIGKLVKAAGLTKLVGDYQTSLKDSNTQFMIDTVTYEGNPNPNVQRLVDWMLSEEGQYIIQKTGYVGMTEQNEVPGGNV